MFGGARPSHKIECFWKASYHPNEKIVWHREMSWIVFGEARPAVDLNVVDSLHNIKTKWFFNAVKWAGPWQGMLGSTAQPQTWMVLNSCITSTRKKVVQPREKNWTVFWGAESSHKIECFWKASYHPDEKGFNTVKWAASCLKKHDQP